MYHKRYVSHVGFGEGDDGWEIYKEEDEDDVSCEDVIAQVQTETLADTLLAALKHPHTVVNGRCSCGILVCERCNEPAAKLDDDYHCDFCARQLLDGKELS